MPLSFPSGPTAGQQYVGDGVTYQYDNTLPAWVKLQPVQSALTGAAAKTSAALLPGGDDAERAAITAPTVGMLRYNDQTLPATIEYYDGSGWVTMASGGGLDGGRFAGGTYPGFPTSVTGWAPSTREPGWQGMNCPSFAGPTASTWGSGLSVGYSWYSTAAGAPNPMSLGANTLANYLFAGLEYVSFVNFYQGQGGSTLNIEDVIPSSGASGGTTLKTISGATFVVSNAGTTMTVKCAALVSWEGGRLTLNSGVSSTFTTPLLTNIETCAFTFSGTGTTLSITNANLSIASVEQIIFCALASENAFGASVGGSINLSGGGNATLSSLSPAAQAAVTTLNGSGWVVTLTP